MKNVSLGVLRQNRRRTAAPKPQPGFIKASGWSIPQQRRRRKKSGAMAIGGNLSALIGPLRRAVCAFIPTIPWELMQRHPMINPGDCGGATRYKRVSVTPCHTTLSLLRSGMARFPSRRNRAHDRGSLSREPI